jgi:hypothetical protein
MRARVMAKKTTQCRALDGVPRAAFEEEADMGGTS